jgi:hypothetical protein
LRNKAGNSHDGVCPAFPYFFNLHPYITEVIQFNNQKSTTGAESLAAPPFLSYSFRLKNGKLSPPS